MRYEYLNAPRGWGKTRYLAHKVTELQDAGHDLVVVVVPNEAHSKIWVELLMDAEIDPSRFMLITPQYRAQVRGSYIALAGVDNADLFDQEELEALLYSIAPGVTNDVVTITCTDPVNKIGVGY